MFILILVALLQAPSAPEPKERYECSGKGPKGDYRLTLEIAKKEDNFWLVWHKGETVQAWGIGLINGEYLSAAFMTAAEKGIGAVSYKVTKGGLEGEWISGDGLKFTEVCTLGNTTKA